MWPRQPVMQLQQYEPFPEGTYVRVLCGMRIGEIGRVVEAKPGVRYLVMFESAGACHYYSASEIETARMRVG